MPTQFRDASGQERLLGTIYVPGATVGDVFTVQSDGSLSPAPGGGSQAVKLERYEVGFADVILEAQEQVFSVAITGGTPTSGDFTLDFDGSSVGPIAFNASVADVQTALDLTFGPDFATAAGSALPGGPVTVTIVQDSIFAAATVSASTLDAGTAGIIQTTPGLKSAGRKLVRTLAAGEVLIFASTWVTEAFNDSGNPSTNLISGVNAADNFLNSDFAAETPADPSGDGFFVLGTNATVPFVVASPDPAGVYVYMSQGFNGDGTTGALTVYLLIGTPA